MVFQWPFESEVGTTNTRKDISPDVSVDHRLTSEDVLLDESREGRDSTLLAEKSPAQTPVFRVKNYQEKHTFLRKDLLVLRYPPSIF